MRRKRRREESSSVQTHYSMIIQWSEEDQAFIVTIPELPGARSHADTYVGAVREGERLITEWLEIAHDQGWEIPAPRVYASASI